MGGSWAGIYLDGVVAVNADVFKDAPCVGEWYVFDSLLASDHAYAKSLCQKCPVILQCRALLREQQADAKGLVGQGGGATGTWAGRLIGKAHKTQRPTKDAS